MNYNMMTSTSRPPFYWKVPAPEKDYMYENVQRIRKTAAQNRFRGSEPMKAAFIPGVTKNAKYAHVTSRVGEFLRSNAERGDEGAFDSPNNSRPSKLYSSSSASKLPNKFSQSQKQVSYHGQPQRGGGGGGPGIVGRGDDGGGFINPRLSRSSTDLSSVTKKKTGNLKGVSSAPQGQPSKMSCEGPGNYVPRAKRKPRGLQAEDESVYNWRFSEGPGNVNSNHSFPHSGDGSNSNNIKHFHRVEYLPCDGICADETVMEDRVGDGGGGGGGDGSGRSSSRTSRGMNTDETRIIEDLQHLEIQQPQQRHMAPHGGSGGGRSQSLERLGRNQIQGQGSGSRRECGNYMEPQDFEEEVDRNGDGGYEEDDIGDLGGSHVTFHQNPYHHSQHHPTQNQRNASTATNTVMKNNYGGGGGGGRGVGVGSGRGANPSVSSTDLPHTLGTVPKYLKQRQEEWKCEADKINAAAAYNADVPPGHVLLSEEERIETLTGLKSKYSMLIDELNRVPIRIDTMRVREYKIQLEQQLQKLERGMAIFSRSRVYVKLPDAGPGAGSGGGGGGGGGTGASRTGGMSSQQQAQSKVST